MYFEVRRSTSKYLQGVPKKLWIVNYSPLEMITMLSYRMALQQYPIVQKGEDVAEQYKYNFTIKTCTNSTFG